MPKGVARKSKHNVDDVGSGQPIKKNRVAALKKVKKSKKKAKK